MASAKLTKRVIDAQRSQDTDYTVWDSELSGFGLRVHPTGRKTFVFKFRPGGGRHAPQRKIAIGEYGALTVEQARREAQRYAGELASGKDPGATRDAARATSRAAREAQTVAQLGEHFLADVEAHHKPATAREYRRMWNADVVPAFGSAKVADVTTAHVRKLHRAMKDRPYSANRTLALLGAFFTFAESEGARPKNSNPANEKIGNRRVIAFYPEQGRERFLTPDEIKRLGEALTRAEREGLPPAPTRRRKRKTGKSAKHRPKSADTPKPANPFAIAAIRFLMLTGWREQEVLTLRWESAAPAQRSVMLEDTKTGRSARKLSTIARDFLAAMPRIAGSPFVFPGRTIEAEDGSVEHRPLVEINRVWYAVRHAAGLTDVRLHDLRHTLASFGASRGHSLLVVGKLLGHKDTATTQRYAHLWDNPVQTAADEIAGEIGALIGIGAQPADSQNPEGLRLVAT